MTIVRHILLVITLMLIAAGTVHAALPAMPEIPVTLPASVRDPLLATRGLLAQRKLALIDEGKSINAECGNLEKDSPKHQVCLERQKTFNAKVEKLRADMESLAVQISNASKLRVATGTAVAQPKGEADTATVDARGPSDFPKALDDAIATAYASAPPGVIGRVRKGFQAVMGRDWPVAKAWFQDALNRDPENPRLKHLTELVDVKMRAAPAPAPVDTRNEPAGLSSGPTGNSPDISARPQTPTPNPATGMLTLPDPNDIRILFPNLEAISRDEAMDILFGLPTTTPK